MQNEIIIICFYFYFMTIIYIMLSSKLSKYTKKLSKFKNIYKLQIGGKEYIYVKLPCEITHLTEKIYCGKSLQPIITEITDTLPYMTIKITNEEFNQDPYIFVKNIDTYENYAIKTRNNEMNIDLQEIILEPDIIGHMNGNNYGGNFISSPPTTYEEYGIICYFSGISDTLQTQLSESSLQDLTELACSFRINNVRHIDELMCFMPYGKHKFKIWTAYIRNIEYTESLQNKINMTCDKDYILNILEHYKMKFTGEILLKLNIVTDKLNEKYTGTQENLTSAYRTIKNRITIPEKQCLENIFEHVDPKIQILKNRDAFLTNLNLEIKNNLNKISRSLFNRDFNDTDHASDTRSQNDDNFVLFPIDLIVTDTYQFIIKHPPVFNRLWIETHDKILCLYPMQTDDEIIRKLDDENMKLKSYMYEQKPIIVKYIDTTIYHSSKYGNAGGNLHCLVKQLFTRS